MSIACSDPPEESCSDARCPAHGDDAYIEAHGGEDLETGHTRDPAGDEAAHA